MAIPINMEYFDEYLRQGDPLKKERAEAWRVAIGLQAVDGLKVSDYLLELAQKNIEGEISMEEVDKLLDEYYEEKHRIRDTWRDRSCRWFCSFLIEIGCHIPLSSLGRCET